MGACLSDTDDDDHEPVITTMDQGQQNVSIFFFFVCLTINYIKALTNKTIVIRFYLTSDVTHGFF